MTNPIKNPTTHLTEQSVNRENASRPRINSGQLFGGHNEIVIEHQGEEYRLRITANGKLILTK